MFLKFIDFIDFIFKITWTPWVKFKRSSLIKKYDKGMGNVDNFDGHVRNTQNRFARNGWKSKSH